jgi:RND family efflux transporter MFP subunit
MSLSGILFNRAQKMFRIRVIKKRIASRLRLWRFVKHSCLFFALAVVATTSAGCKSGYPASAQNRPKEATEPKPVKLARVTELTMERTVTVTGMLTAYEQATLSAKVPGRLQSITVDLGSVVRRGQVIAQLEQQDYLYRVKQAEAALAQARARLGLALDGKDDHVDPEETGTVRQARALLDDARLKRERAVKLLEKGVIAQAQMDAADAEYKVALSRYQDAIEEIRNRQAIVLERRSQLELARQQLADTTVYAPFDGVVQERRATVGEFLAAGAPIVTIVKIDPLRLRVEVPEREARNIRLGQTVRVMVEGDATTYAGHIARLSPSITAQNRMLMVEAEVRNNGQLRPGAFVRADIVTSDSTPATVVPTNSIVAFAGIEKVITVEDGKAIEKPITTGRRSGDWTEVLSGVKVGELVVVDPGNLQSGQPVTVIE